MTTKKTPPPGATLHLGGDAYAHPSLADRLTPIENAVPYPGNPRRGDQDAITNSIRDLGLYTGVVCQRSTGHILVGNHRRHALAALGATRIPVDTLDVDDTRAAAIVARDNRTSDQGGYDDAELVALLTSSPDVLALSGYGRDDLDLILNALDGDDTGPVYTRRADPIQYHPTRETPPAVETLVNRDKTHDLVRAVLAADLDAELAAFLIAGAQRHLVFDYAKIAEFYAHAPAEVQALMEASALVIVDYDDAISHGFVRISDRLSALLDADQSEREALDA